MMFKRIINITLSTVPKPFVMALPILTISTARHKISQAMNPTILSTKNRWMIKGEETWKCTIKSFPEESEIGQVLFYPFLKDNQICHQHIHQSSFLFLGYL